MNTVDRIVRPGPPIFIAPCRRCGTRHHSTHLWANLDGPAFTYVCDGCVTWERQERTEA